MPREVEVSVAEELQVVPAVHAGHNDITELLMHLRLCVSKDVCCEVAIAITTTEEAVEDASALACVLLLSACQQQLVFLKVLLVVEKLPF